MRTSLLEGLQNVDWGAVARVYGNCHATLIGAVVTWWTRHGPDYFAFEAGPRHGVPETRKAGACDAILARGTVPEAVVEVEGTDRLGRLEQIGCFFDSPKLGLKAPQEGILIAYRTGAHGRGAERRCDRVDCGALSKRALKMTSRSPGRAIVVVAMHKKWETICSPFTLRETNAYYRSTLCEVSAQQFLNGREDGRRCYFPAPAQRPASP